LTADFRCATARRWAAMAESLPGVSRVVAPHSYTFLFIAGLGFAAADAFGIGSNDVANSFATSVGSRSLSLRRACAIAAFTELFGAAVLGGSVTAGIKGKRTACSPGCAGLRRYRRQHHQSRPVRGPS
jgi:hypothetical protein